MGLKDASGLEAKQYMVEGSVPPRQTSLRHIEAPVKCEFEHPGVAPTAGVDELPNPSKCDSRMSRLEFVSSKGCLLGSPSVTLRFPSGSRTWRMADAMRVDAKTPRVTGELPDLKRNKRHAK